MRNLRRVRLPALLVAAAVALGACGSDDATVAAPAPAPLSGADKLAANAAQADELIGDGRAAFDKRMAELEGHPVVVNQWASWCESCRFEFPFFKDVVARYSDRVAFLGLDSADERGSAQQFLAEFPVGFPSVFDEDASVARLQGGGRSWPMTFFYDAEGNQVHARIGAYATVEQLEADVKQFALGRTSS